MLCILLRERCTLAMAQSTCMDPGLNPVPSQLFIELLYFMLLLLPKLFAPGKFLEVQLPDSEYLCLVLMHLVHTISSHPNCGHSLVSFQVLLRPYAYQTSQSSLINLGMTYTSVKSSLFFNQKKFLHLQACLLLSVCHCLLMLVALHPLR